MITLVHKTFFRSVSGTSNPVVTLSTPSTAGNWIVLCLNADFSLAYTPTTDQGEVFTLIGRVTGVVTFTGSVFWLLQSTKNCATVTLTTTHPGSTVYYVGLFEINGVSLQYVNQGGVNGGTGPSTHAIETKTSVDAVSLVGPLCVGGSGTTFYIAGLTEQHTAGGSPTMTVGVTAGWTLDQQNLIVPFYQAAIAYILGTGTQQPTFTNLASVAMDMDSPGIFIQEGVVSPTTTTTTLTSSVDPSTPGQSVNFVAIVNGPGGPGSPTGTVMFTIDGILVATVAVSSVSSGVSQAAYATSTLTLGHHPVIAIYSGDSNYTASTSPVVDQFVVQQCPFPFATALQQLANRLYDPTMQFWSQTELILYFQEAFRTWNALTSYWRGDFNFQSQQGVVFYDITNTTTAPNTLRPTTVTDQYLYNLIEYHLLEPAVGAGPWTGSLQFSIDDILNAVQRRQNEILGVTGCSVQHSTTNAAPDRIYMLNTTLDIRRVAYTPLGGATTPMFEDDTWGIQAFAPNYTTQPQGVPSTYRKSTEPLLSFDADVPPMPGAYDLITIESGPVLNTSQSSTFTIPDDWTWVLKWGALADLLGRESNAKDLLRAKYCEGRYKQGLSLLSNAAAILAARTDNTPLQIEAIKSSDLYNPTWQGQPQGSPSTALVAGLNLAALSPPPSSGPFSITLTVVENAPVPVNLTDCLLLTQDVYDIILDYAQHLAAFKMGGAEFLQTESHLVRFMQMAALYSSKLAEQGEFSKILYAISQSEMNMNPRYSADTDPAAGGDQ